MVSVSEHSFSQMTMAKKRKVNESDHWCRTSTGKASVTTFTWTIEDFESRPEKLGEEMFSSTFLAKKPDGKDSMWRLSLYPKGEEKDTHLAIYLENKNKFQMKANFRVSILDLNLSSSET